MPDICGIELLIKTRVALTASEKVGRRAGVQKKKKFKQIKGEGVQ